MATFCSLPRKRGGWALLKSSRLDFNNAMAVTFSLGLQSVVGVPGFENECIEVNQYLTPHTPHPIVTEFLKAIVFIALVSLSPEQSL
jgi:hypothetical protein